MSNLTQRIITGLIYGITSIACLSLSPVSFVVFFLVAMVIGLNEFYNLAEKLDYKPNRVLATISSVLIFVSFLSICLFPYYSKTLAACSIFSILAIFVSALFQKENKSFNSTASTFLAISYVALPFSLTSLIAFQNGIFECEIILSSFILVWLSDTGGYFIGVKFGKRKLMERISPKKSWEGAVGSLLFSIIGAIIISEYFTIFNTYEWIILSIIICVSSILGDLIESMFKRNAGIKDTGNILPGHGGVLDRFDSIIFALPMIYIFQLIIL
ncbi:MAG: phosphatidate cytidylyltransferase [Flavobacteriales bacterium]